MQPRVASLAVFVLEALRLELIWAHFNVLRDRKLLATRQELYSSSGSARLEESATVLTVTGIVVMSLAAAARTRGGYHALTCGLRELHGDDAGRYRDYCVTGNHERRSHELSENRFRGDISIANGRHSHDSPVDADRDARKAIGLALNQIHQRTDDDHDRQHG